MQTSLRPSVSPRKLHGVILLLLLNYPVLSQKFTISAPDANGKYGVKNDKGTLVIPQQYVSIVPLPEDNFLVYEENPGWPMILNQKNQVMVSKRNYIAKALDAFNSYFICQYYKEGKMAELVLFKAPDSVVYTFPVNYLSAEFVRDSCYTYVRAQTINPGERLSVDLKGKAIMESGTTGFDYIKRLFKPCNGYAIVMKEQGAAGTLHGVYDLTGKKMILPCRFYDIEFDEQAGLIKAFKPVYTATYDLYNLQGGLVKTWDQLKK